ncbi:MAG: C10 family peptidase, partial [Duncaniella sp.]|nr:C10 family peptidase [Duncaniella sp.]
YNGPGTPALEAVLTGGPKAKPLYYVFNASDNAGFVIISAEDVTSPVLGYAFEGNYPVIAQPDAMKWMMAGLENDLKVAPEVQQAPARIASRAADEKKELSTAAWSQEGPFNSMIPGKPLVGCVGTAMATIMKYHQWPSAGTGSFDGVDFGVSYDWSSMRTDNYRSGYTQSEGDAVATLMYHASKSIDTRYDMSGSSAYEVRVPAALSTYFGYDPGVSYKKRSEVGSQAEWDKIVKDEIDAGRPVLYCGQDVTAGHAFVCDGYDGEYLHFNWGWGGAGNGYFLSTALNPTVSRTHSYNNLNTIIYNIKPSTSSIAAWSPIHITADANQVGIGTDMTDLSSGKSFTVRVGNLKNLSYSDFSGKVAVALCDAAGKMKALLSSPSNFSLQSMATLFNSYIELKDCKLPSVATVESTDRVRLITQAEGSSDWIPVAGALPTVNDLPVKVAKPASFPVTLPAAVAGVEVEGASNVILGWDYSFKVVAQNPADDVITVKDNGFVLTPGEGNTYT